MNTLVILPGQGTQESSLHSVYSNETSVRVKTFILQEYIQLLLINKYIFKAHFTFHNVKQHINMSYVTNCHVYTGFFPQL